MTAVHEMTHLPLTPDLVVGAVELERTERGLRPHRLTAQARAQSNDGQLVMAESQPSGVRLALRTAATVLELEVVPTKRVYVGMPARPHGVYDLVGDGHLLARTTAKGGDSLTVDISTGAAEHRTGDPVTLRFDALPAGEKDIEVWLPYDETTELVALRINGTTAAMPDRGRRTWLHHGSSISQGSGAESPTTTWPAIAAAAAGVDLMNLGLGGSALLDPFTARVLRDLPADAISIKIGINIVNNDLMRLRAFGPAVHGFLDTIREGHPQTPMLVVSPVLCPIHEDTPGPTGFDAAALAEGRLTFRATGDPAERAQGKLTLQTIRQELTRIVAERSQQDRHLHLLDGRTLYGEADAAQRPLPDGLHPDAATHRQMGERFAALAFGRGHPLALVR